MIVSGGEISLNASCLGYKIHGKQIQSIKLDKNQYKLLSFDFLFNKEMKYDIKCLDYCVIYKMSKEELCKIIQNNPYNYQYYCATRDKDKYNLA